MLKGISGVVFSVEDTTIQFIPESEAIGPDPVPVEKKEIRKQFLPGDFVEVVAGPHSGAQGFVVATTPLSVVIYRRSATIFWTSKESATSVENEGQEVRNSAVGLEGVSVMPLCATLAFGEPTAFRLEGHTAQFHHRLRQVRAVNSGNGAV
jgi:ribosomal protein L24